MKHRRGAGRESETSPAGSLSEAIPTLPAWKAFVVQFTREAGKETGTFAGRVEHLSSGRRHRFDSTAELVKTLERLLGEIAGEYSENR